MDELWVVRAGTVPYRRAWAWQRALVERRAADAIPDTVLLLEHPHVYTIGKRGSDADVLADPAWLTANGAEVVRSDRGGQVTYHGPGQLVGYPITRLDPSPDIWRFVGRVEQALVEVAAAFGLEARGERGDLTGVWVGDAKLGAIGMRGSRGVTSLLGRQVPVAEALPVVERQLAERLERTPVLVDPATLDLPAEDYDPETVPC